MCAFTPAASDRIPVRAGWIHREPAQCLAKSNRYRILPVSDGTSVICSDFRPKTLKTKVCKNSFFANCHEDSLTGTCDDFFPKLLKTRIREQNIFSRSHNVVASKTSTAGAKS